MLPALRARPLAQCSGRSDSRQPSSAAAALSPRLFEFDLFLRRGFDRACRRRGGRDRILLERDLGTAHSARCSTWAGAVGAQSHRSATGILSRLTPSMPGAAALGAGGSLSVGVEGRRPGHQGVRLRLRGGPHDRGDAHATPTARRGTRRWARVELRRWSPRVCWNGPPLERCCSSVDRTADSNGWGPRLRASPHQAGLTMPSAATSAARSCSSC